MTANQLALLLACYRGYAAAITSEQLRNNCQDDARILASRGLISPGAAKWDPPVLTSAGDALVKVLLGAAQ